MENGFNLGDFRQRKRFDQKAYKLPPPTPAHAPFETNKRPLEQQPKPFSKKKRVVIAPIIRPSLASVRIIKPSTALATPQPVSIPEPPERTTPQILLPDPPPERTTPQILLPDPPVLTTPPFSRSTLPTTPDSFPDPPLLTTPQIFYQIHLCQQPLKSFFQIHLSRQHLRSFYQIHLWSRLWSRPLRMTLPWIKSCRLYLETICNKGFPWRILKNLRCWTRCLPCLTRVMISSRFWIILKQGWP
ncbi:hypothetical protein TNCV_2991091 [Trichonephila clavipes]|nr:hypothetical protein TNCV_2991091 [Trichonephila clavipes]